MENERKYDLNEAICKLVIAKSRNIELILDKMDDTEIFTKEELLLTSHQATQLVNQLVNIKD